MSQFNIEGEGRTKNGTPIGKVKRAFKATKTMPAIEGNFFFHFDVSQDFKNEANTSFVMKIMKRCILGIIFT